MAYKKLPALRAEPFTEDTSDGERLAFVDTLWTRQDAGLLRFARQVEENVRMLFGDQWIVWSPMLGQFLDLLSFLDEDQRIFKQRPVVNRLLFWFMLTHARMTENPPILTFRPGPDEIDAQLAKAWDTTFKVLWEETGMQENLELLFAWMIPGTQAFLKSRVDPRSGAVKEFRGPATLPIYDADGELINQLDVEDVPFGPDGQPLATADTEGNVVETGPAFQMHEGGIAVDVLAPLECRGEWNAKPWHKKRWHMHRTYLSSEEVFETYGVDVEPDTFGQEAEGSGELQRLLFGSGWYGAVNDAYDRTGGGIQDWGDGLVRVTEFWHEPCEYPGMQKRVDPATDQIVEPGGRLLTVSKHKVLRDGPRPAPFPYTSPLRQFRFLFLPGRPAGSTPQEALNPLQRQYNRGYAQIAEHVNLLCDPIMVIDQMTGLEEGDIDNTPGQQVVAHMQPNVSPIMFVTPPPLGTDVYKYQDMLLREMQDLGNIEGSEGRVPTPEASGQLVKELRFNADRFIGPPLRRAVIEMTRLAEDWMAWVQVLWTEEKVLVYTGEDSVAETITLMPDLFRGKVNIVPDLESMLPEGRGERQAKVHAMWLEGAFGPPDTPEAARRFLELARFPHLGRAAMPGGVHRETANQENGQIATGALAATIPLFPWYDDLIHLEVHEEFMSGQNFLRLDPLVQQEFAIHRDMHMQAMLEKVMEQFIKQAAMNPEMVAPNGGGNGNGGPSRIPSSSAAARGGAQPPPGPGAFEAAV